MAAMIWPDGPMSPATTTGCSAALASTRATAAVRFSWSTRSSRPWSSRRKAIATEGVGQEDLRARGDVAALDPPDDLGVLQIPQLRRIAELEPVGHEHGAHRAVGDDRAVGAEELLPRRHRCIVLGTGNVPDISRGYPVSEWNSSSF